MESGEGGRRRESDESREHKEEDERSKEIDEFVERWERSREIDEFVKNWEHERERENKEESENQGDIENPKEYQENKRHNDGEEYSKEFEDKESGEESEEADDEDEFSRRVDEVVRDAVRELEEEKTREEAEKQEAEERSKEPNEYDELEEKMKESFEDRGVPREEMEARWKEGQEADMEEEMEEKNEDTTSDANESKNDTEEGSASGETAEGESYHESGEGMVYATKEGSSSETQESTTQGEEESEEQTESKVQETTHEQSEESSSETQEPTEERQSTERPTSECIEDSENQETKELSEDSEESSQRREGNEGKEKRENQVENAESKTEDTLEQSERSQEGGSSQEDESNESAYHEGDSDQDVSEKKSKQESQGESARESESSEHRERQETENEESQETEEEATAEETDQEELDDSEPSPYFPEGYPEEAARMLPDEFNMSLFPYPDEYSEEELTEDEIKELEEFIREVEESTNSDIETEEDLKRALEENPEYYEAPMFDTYYENAVKYLEYKQKLKERYSEEELEEISHVDAARELGFTLAESSHWFDDRNVPFLIGELKKAMKRKNMTKALKKLIERKVADALTKDLNVQKHKKKAKSLRGKYKRKTTYPQIRDNEVRSSRELMEIIERSFPWLKEREDFKRLIDAASLFFSLLKKWRKEKEVSRQDILTAIQDHDVSVETVKDWVKGVAHPQIFDIIHYGLSVEEGNALADELVSKLNGVNDFKSYPRIMKSLYITDLLRSHKFYTKEVERVRQYFRFLAALRRGGLHRDFARRSGAPESTTKAWILFRTTPRYLKYACSVPKTSPGRGKRWLPLVVKESGLEHFISVPLKIRVETDL